MSESVLAGILVGCVGFAMPLSWYREGLARRRRRNEQLAGYLEEHDRLLGTYLSNERIPDDDRDQIARVSHLVLDTPGARTFLAQAIEVASYTDLELARVQAEHGEPYFQHAPELRPAYTAIGLSLILIASMVATGSTRAATSIMTRMADPRRDRELIRRTPSLTKMSPADLDGRMAVPA